MKFVPIRSLRRRASEDVGCEDRRAHRRVRTLDRLVRVATMGDTGLCCLINISDWGMKLATGLSLNLQEVAWVTFSDTLILSGQVIWTHGEECGLQFDERVNCMLLLRQLADDLQERRRRALRLPLDTRALVVSELGQESVRVLDISQNGMKIAHPHLDFGEDLIVKVRLETGLERRGIIRWSHAGVAGVRLLKPIVQSELVSARRLGSKHCEDR